MLNLVHRLPRAAKLLFAGALATLPLLTLAETNSAYSHERTIALDRSRWLASIPDDRRLRDLSLPGTHDSVTGEATGLVIVAETQTLPLKAQLRAGVRVLDVRCRHIGNAFTMHHGAVYLGKNLDDVLQTVTEFLQQHPSETVLMRVKEEHNAESVSRSFADTFAAYWQHPRYRPYFWWPDTDNPTLGGVRGKIVVLQDFGSAHLFGLNYGAFNAQDHYVVASPYHLYDKWLRVKQHLEAANATAPGARDRFFINYLSGSTGVLPYFVASGKVTPGTHDPLAPTGLTTPLFNSHYPDFPRVNCFWGMCSIAFYGTNPLAMNHINRSAGRIRFVGIVMADYPGAGLIDTVIRLNGAP